MSDRLQRMLALLVGALMFIGFGVLIFWTAYGIETQLNRAKNWSSTTGVVIRSELKSSNSDKGRRYRAEVEYRYKVNGETYVSDCVSPGRSAPSPEGRVNAYREGKRIKVYYDPENPMDAVLDYKSRDHNSVNFFFSIVFFVLGLCLLRLFIKEIRFPGSVIN